MKVRRTIRSTDTATDRGTSKKPLQSNASPKTSTRQSGNPSSSPRESSDGRKSNSGKTKPETSANRSASSPTNTARRGPSGSTGKKSLPSEYSQPLSLPGSPRLKTATAAPLPREVLLLLGEPGTGKTTLARTLAKRARRCVAIDTLGADYGHGVVVETVGQWREYWHRCRFLPDLHIVARPQDEDLPVQIWHDLWNDRHETRARGLVTWNVVEEADMYCTAGHTDPDLQKCISWGRQFGISLIACARRPALISRTLSAAATCVVCHRITEPTDVEYIRKKVSRQIGDQVDTLPDFHWLADRESAILGINATKTPT